MKKNIKKMYICLFVFVVLTLISCDKKTEKVKDNEGVKTINIDDENINKNVDIHYIKFNNNEAFLDDKKIVEYKYVWHIDSNGDYNDVKDSPSEYYTGDKPDGTDGIWIAHDIKYFPMIDKNKFYKHEDGNDPEWNVNFENEKYKNLVFASLPRGYNDEFPSHMMHSEEEAYNNPCIHITTPGTYELSGKWNGQIFVDLGKDSIEDPNKKINLLLNNVEINCTVAPAINIYRTYECDNKWKDRKESTYDIDLENTGANVILKDNTKNYINGVNVYKIYKTALKKSGNEQKKAIKYDAAIQSATSISIDSEKLNNGELYINSSLEGISTDLHIIFNGGKIYIDAADDGINCNEYNVSILKINNADIMVNAGLLYQGDGIDSNGYILMNGGNVVAVATYEQDPGIDAVNGVYINGGSLVALGETETVDWPKIYMNENINQSYIFKSFDNAKSEDSQIIVIDENGKEIYKFSEKDIPHIYDKKRPFIGAFISNPNIKKDVKYNMIVK